MNRRLVLACVGSTFSSIVAGCSVNNPATAQCRLVHEVVASSDDYGEVLETYSYGDLSGGAQQVFEKAVTNGSYTTTNQRKEPAEFRYWDTTAVYNITYQDQTYVLLTYTGSGCDRK